MKVVVVVVVMCILNMNGQTANKILPSDFWSSLSESEKLSFVNGAYGAISLLKKSHKDEVAKQYLHDKNWIEPYQDYVGKTQPHENPDWPWLISVLCFCLWKRKLGFRFVLQP